ncbi:MAG: GspB domain-containing protein [Lysobacter sp.]|nr:GspB domain-containing protein [Lysobacter sp.]
MSFILDALRKSETARRRSEAPDLFTTMPGTAAPAPARKQWPLLAIGGVGVLSLIAALWLFAQRSPSPPAALPVSDAVIDANAPPSAPTATETQAPAPIPTTSEPPQQAIATEAPAAPMKASPAPVATTVARELPAPPPEPDIAPPVPQVQPATPATGDQIVSLADLDPEARKQLPALKLSMHLWNEAPSQRFVIVDGQRLKEGDVLGEIVIERITRDGAVLVWRGSRLKIELR